MDIAAGEYGDRPFYFRRMLAGRTVNCLQADATRCGGYTGFLKAAAACARRSRCRSRHSPQLHAHVGCALFPASGTWSTFTTTARIANLLFAGALEPRGGAYGPTDRVGHGLELKAADAARYRL